MIDEQHDPVVVAVAAYCREHGMCRRRHIWYLTQEETVAIIRLEKSTWGPEYGLRLDVALRMLFARPLPAWGDHHITCGAEQLAGVRRFRSLVLDQPMEPDARAAEIRALLGEYAWPTLTAVSRIEGFASERGQALLRYALVMGSAQRVLREAGVPKPGGGTWVG